MKFPLDECMLHAFARRLSERGYSDTLPPVHIGLRRAADHVLVRRALEQDRIIITANADDFRTLLARLTLHPGLIVMPNAELEQSWRLLHSALAYIERHSMPADDMINRVVAVLPGSEILDYELPEPDDA